MINSAFAQQAQADMMANPSAALMAMNAGPVLDEGQIAASNPSLIGGYRIVFDRECPLELHVVDEEMIEKIGHSVQTHEVMLVKILIKGHEENPESIKVELLSKADYYFCYEHVCDVFDYQQMKDQQGLKPQYADYLTMLIKLFNQAIGSQDTKCQMQTNKDDTGDLFFNQMLPYKQLQLLGCRFNLAPDQKVQEHIKYRHMVARLKLQQMQAKLSQICKLVKERNPSLIQHICTQVQIMRGPSSYQLDSKRMAAAKKRSSTTGTRSNRSRASGGRGTTMSMTKRSTGASSVASTINEERKR